MAESLSGLDTRAACLRYVRRICRDQAEVEKDHKAWRQRPEVEGNEVALVQAHKAITRLRDHTGDALQEVALRMATLEASAE